MPWTTSYYHYDAVGTTRQLTGSTETVTDSYLNDAFGNQVAATGTTENPFRYVGQVGYYWDTDSASYYVRQRAYQPTIIRWLSLDPMRFMSGNTNHFQYVGSNPINALDPSGLYAEGGHFYTTYIVAIAAGKSPEDAYMIAYHSQLPDQVKLFDAMSNWYESLNPTSDYKWQIDVFYYLHSLTGLSGRNLVNYRQKLVDMIACKCGNLSDRERGIVIHALGDAYAHTFDGPSGPISYRWPDGHGNVGKRPDVIGNFPDKYKDYVRALYIALGGKGKPDDNPLIMTLLDKYLLQMPTSLGTTQPAEEANLLRLFIRLELSKPQQRPWEEPIRFNPGEYNVDKDTHTPTQQEIRDLIRKMKKCLNDAPKSERKK